MARRGPIRAGLALALVFVISNVLADDKCRSGCHGAPQTFKYTDGTTYKYNFDSKVEITLSSAQGQKTTTEVKAQVLLTQQPQCNQVLRLQNVHIIGSDGKKYINIPDVDKPIRINFHDGHIEDSICAVPGDTQNSINIKRAIASIFQANLKNGHETDVFGLCPTEVNHHKEGNVLVVQKTRNLNKCAYRENVKQDFLATAFNLNSEIKSSPILNADYSAKLRIKNGILDQAVVTENYLYVPFSVGNNGAKASVETKLQFIGTSKDNPQAKVSQSRSIIFENPHPVNSPTSNVNSILNAVKETAKTIGVTVGEHTAKEFINLVKILRVSNKDDLLAVYNQVRAGVGFADKVTAKKLFLDAILRAGNGDNVEVAIELLKNKELNAVEQKLVFIGLSLVRHVSESSIVSATTLLNQPNLPREAYLGIGTLAGHYCREHSCKNNDAVNKLIQKFIQKLGDGKAANKEDENDIIFVLKALGNVHHLSDSILNKITAIAQDKKAPNRLRVTALEAYLADPCKDKLRDSALNILKDIQQDSEVRIKAYLAATQCPNAKVGNAIKTLLENEPSYQVGGFIAAHIRNIRSSANPDKELAKQHLGFINVPKRFPVDLRKWSHSGEFSYSINTLGIANSIEGNVIYSQSSFLPRSASLNLTADVFGHTFNFLEIEARQENLDRLIEHYLGPKGLLRSKNAQELWDSKGKHAKEVIGNLQERISKSLRARRDVSKGEIDSIAKQVQIKTNELNADLDVDLGIKAFGSEILFLNINDDVKQWTPEAIIDKIVEGFNKGLDHIKHFEETLRSNLLLLDAEFAYPTASGFPLRLGVEGSANIQVKAAGGIDVPALLKQDSTVKISLIPSANVQIAGRLTVDAFLVENGLKVVSSLHTATGGDLIFQVFKEGVDVKFSIPLEKQDIISASHDIVFHTRELGAPERNVPLKFAQNKDFSICLDQLSPLIGLTFCGEINGPNLSGKEVPILPFPLAGDARVAVTIEREGVSQYHYRHVLHADVNTLGIEISAATLDQNHQKKVSLDVEAYLSPEKRVKATLVSPIKTATVEGRIINDDREKSALVRFVHDNNEFYGKVGVSIAGSPAKAIYTPILEYRTPQHGGVQHPPYRVEGRVIAEKNGPNVKYTFDNVKFVSPASKPFSVDGNVGGDSESIYADVTASDGTNSGSLVGRVHASAHLLKVNVEVKNSLNPNANFHIKGEIAKQPEEVKSFLQVIHGSDLGSKTNILTLNNLVKFRNKGPQDYFVITKNTLTYPLLGIDVKVDFDHKPGELDYDVNFQYGDVKVGSELESEWKKKPEGHEYELEFEVYGLNNRVELKSKRQIKGEHSQIEHSVDVNGKKVEIAGKVKHHIKPQDIDIGADLVVKTPQHGAPIKVNGGLKYNIAEIDSFYKVSSGGTVYADVFFKATKGGNANGSIKVALKNHVNINGAIKANKGNGNGEIVIELPSIHKAIKADGTFTIHDPTYNLAVNVYPVFNEDKSKKIAVSTQNKITAQSIDTKNTVDFFGHILEVNAKGNAHGDIQNGKINGEVEITLPNNQYFVGKINREAETVNGVMNVNAGISAEQRDNKNAPGRKVSWKGVAKDTNPKENIFDITFNAAAENGNGKNINLDGHYKAAPQGEANHLDFNSKLYGSVLTHPLEVVVTGNCKQQHRVGSYQIRETWGPHNVAQTKFSYDIVGEGRPISGDINIDVSTSSKILKSLKISTSGSALKSDRIDLKGSGSVYADAPDGVIVDVSSNGEVQASDKDGRVKGTVKYGKIEPISVNAGYSRSEEKEKQQVQGDASIQYGQNKNIKGDVTIIKLSDNEYKLDVKLDTPAEKFRSNSLQLHTKRSEDNTHYQSESTLTSDGRTWKSSSDLVLSEVNPSIDFKVTCPEGKLSQLAAKVTKFSNKQFGGEFKLINQKNNFILESTIDSNFETIDDFHIKATAHCPVLKIEKVVIEVQNKPAKAGRRIQVVAKSANKNILAGSTSYQAREERGKLIVEGSGSFKVKDQTKSANFKYIRQNLSQEKNGETGIEISLDAGLGNEAVDIEFKFTNKQFRISNSYCEEKKQCAHIEIDAKTSVEDITHFNQELEIAVDLRKLGLSHEFGLKAVTNRKEYIIDHTVDIHFQSQENNKYKYSLYLHPKEAGVSLTTPNRIVSLEGNINPPRKVKGGGKATAEIAFYLDKKNQPNQKTALSGWLDVDQKDDSLKGEIRFTNPALRRPLSISGSTKFTTGKTQSFSANAVIDIFAQPNQKIIINYQETAPEISKEITRYDYVDFLEIKSTGLNIDIREETYANFNAESNHAKTGYSFKYHVGNSRYVSALNWELSPTQYNFLLRILNIDLLKVSSQLQLNKDVQIVDTEISSYGVKPAVSHLEVKHWNTVKFNIARKDNPHDKLQVSSGLITGQIADFRAEIYKGGNPYELVHATVKLDEANFLKTDYGVQSKNIQDLLLTPIKNDITNHLKELKNVAENWSKQLSAEIKNLIELVKRATPNLTPLKDYYIGELKKIKDEILADKTIKEISEFLHNIAAAISQAFGETFTHFSQLVESIVHAVHASFNKVLEVVDKEIAPKVKELVDKLAAVAADIADKISDIVLIYLAKISEIAEKYQPELKQIGAALSEISQDVVRVFAKAYESIRALIIEQWNQVYSEIKALPVFEELKAQYKTFVAGGGVPSTEALVNTLKDLTSTVKDLVPLEEFKTLVDVIAQYIEKKLTRQQIDDYASLNRIGQAAAALAKRLVGSVTSEGIPEWDGTSVSFPTYILNKLPKLVAVKFSPIAYLLKEDVPGVSDFILSLINQPRNLVPPFPLYALVAQGQHIFTFDGKHLTFPGNCNYLLARDALDGNFTIIGTYSGGILIAITLAEGHDSVTLKKGGQVLLNNAPTELPARKPNIAAFRNYERIELVTSAGARVICGPELVVCSVTVSGFYHGKLRGLLGNGNNEPYDDFTLGNGKIVTSETDFGNNYKLAAGCPAVKAVEHHGHHPVPSCDKLFGWESELRYCYPFVSTANFKTACTHGVAQGVKDTEQAIAIAYVAACNQHNIPVVLPAEFVKCTNGEKPVGVGEKFSVKTPAKAADIVILLDTVKSNEPIYKEYVQPLVQQLTNELHAKGISDVEFHLITYGGDNQWPSHVTVGGKLTFKGKVPNVKFSESPKSDQVVTTHADVDQFLETLRSIGHDVQLALGQDLQAKTYDEGLKYPFRANAIKSIIAITGNPCQVGRFYPVQVLRTLLYRSKTVNLNLITPFEKLTVKDAKHTKDVVGFNSNNVFTLSQSKNRPKGGAELHKELDYSDYCVDFTLQNRGNVFVIDNFLQAKGVARKQFVQVTSHNIVDQFLSVEQGLECECKFYTPFSAVNVCSVVQSKEKPQVARKVGTKS